MSLTVTGHQPTYLSWLGLFDKIAMADQFVIVDTVAMDGSSDTSFENRNRILTRSGPLWLTVPVYRVRDQPLSDIRVCNEQHWRRKHWRSIELAYAKAPFWEMYSPWLLAFYGGCDGPHGHSKNAMIFTHLVDLCEVMLRRFISWLGISTIIRRASTMDLAGTKSELVLDMCKKLGADRYVFGALGANYADVATFKAAGVEPIFQSYRHPTYQQQWGGAFVPNLSVLDLLMNVGPRSLDVLRGARSTDA
jgi:hypothetical protein